MCFCYRSTNSISPERTQKYMDKVEAVVNYPNPNNLKEVTSNKVPVHCELEMLLCDASMD